MAKQQVHVHFHYQQLCLFSTVSSGGADLKVKLVPNSLKNCDTLHLSGETKRLLIGAEKLKIKKRRVSGISAEFCVQTSDEFQGFANGGEGFLTLSECERIIFMALQHIKPHEDGTVPGYSDVKLHKGRAISKFIYYMTSSVSRQGEPNPAL